jgi:hypothetical protein
MFNPLPYLLLFQLAIAIPTNTSPERTMYPCKDEAGFATCVDLNQREIDQHSDQPYNSRMCDLYVGQFGCHAQYCPLTLNATIEEMMRTYCAEANSVPDCEFTVPEIESCVASKKPELVNCSSESDNMHCLCEAFNDALSCFEECPSAPEREAYQNQARRFCDASD